MSLGRQMLPESLDESRLAGAGRSRKPKTEREALSAAIPKACVSALEKRVQEGGCLEAFEGVSGLHEGYGPGQRRPIAPKQPFREAGLVAPFFLVFQFFVHSNLAF